MANISIIVEKAIKEVGPYGAVSGGVSLTQTPLPTLQIVGYIIGSFGVVAALWRCYEVRLSRIETKRANDLNLLKFNTEQKEKSKQ